MGARFSSGRDIIKRALDRRYIRKSELEVVRSRLTELELEIQSAVSTIEQQIDEVMRLATECARAIETTLQGELLLRRDLDSAIQIIESSISNPLRKMPVLPE